MSEFTYLDSNKTKDQDCKLDFSRRKGMAEKKIIDLRNLWKEKVQLTSSKKKITKTLVGTTITYGQEGGTIKTNNKKEIQMAEMWCYRRLANIYRREKLTNKSIIEQLKHIESFLI